MNLIPGYGQPSRQFPTPQNNRNEVVNPPSPRVPVELILNIGDSLLAETSPYEVADHHDKAAGFNALRRVCKEVGQRLDTAQFRAKYGQLADKLRVEQRRSIPNVLYADSRTRERSANAFREEFPNVPPYSTPAKLFQLLPMPERKAMLDQILGHPGNMLKGGAIKLISDNMEAFYPEDRERFIQYGLDRDTDSISGKCYVSSFIDHVGPNLAKLNEHQRTAIVDKALTISNDALRSQSFRGLAQGFTDLDADSRAKVVQEILDLSHRPALSANKKEELLILLRLNMQEIAASQQTEIRQRCEALGILV